MTARATLRALLARVLRSEDHILRFREFNEIVAVLIGQPYDTDPLVDILTFDASTGGAFLLQGERDSLLHVINGGSLDDVMANN